MNVAAATLGALPDQGAVAVAESPKFVRRLLRRPVAIVCLVYLAGIIGVAIVAPIVLPGINSQHAGNLLAVDQGPSAAHWLGTDTLGRDVLDRLLVGTRVTLIGVVEALIVFLALGVPLGLAAGFFGGWTDRVVTWMADLAFSIPSIILIIVVLSVFPESMLAGMCTLGVLAAPGLMRIARSATLPVREELYIAAAQVSGLSRPYILRRHVLPRISGAIIVQASLFSASALLVQTGLGFLNLLVAAPAPSWGGMVADGTSVILLQPWLIWPPGMAIAITILAFGLLGDSVRDATTEGWSAPARRRRRRSRRKAPSHHAPVLPPRPAVDPEPGVLLSIHGLSIAFSSKDRTTRVVEDVSFDIKEGETVGIVGETGCGKTITATSILGLVPGTGRIEQGRILFAGKDLAALSERELCGIRGKEIALVSQEPMISLDPAFRVGNQLQEAIRCHHPHLSGAAAKALALELLASVHLPDPKTVARRYPHELSGGMAQRVAIARALAGKPKLLIADEPTTALDVTVQAEILALLRELQRKTKMAILLVTHDWGVVADICERAVVMYAGQVVERAEITSMFKAPLHPYTKALLASNPQNTADSEMLPVIPGGVPQPGGWPTGCHFHPRCAYATAACKEQPVSLVEHSPSRETRCIHHEVLAR